MSYDGEFARVCKIARYVMFGVMIENLIGIGELSAPRDGSATLVTRIVPR